MKTKTIILNSKILNLVTTQVCNSWIVAFIISTCFFSSSIAAEGEAKKDVKNSSLSLYVSTVNATGEFTNLANSKDDADGSGIGIDFTSSTYESPLKWLFRLNFNSLTVDDVSFNVSGTTIDKIDYFEVSTIFGGQYYFRGKNKIKPYLGGGIAISYLNLETNVSSSTLFGTGVDFQAGVQWDISEKWFLKTEYNYRYQPIYTNETGVALDNASASAFNLGLGFKF